MYIIFLFLFKKSQGPGDMGATATVDIDTSIDVDAQAIFEKSQQINKVTHKDRYSAVNNVEGVRCRTFLY